MLKLVLTTLKMTPLFEAVTVPFVAQFIDDEGDFVPSDMIDQAANAMLDELLRVSQALTVLRGGTE